LVCVQFVIRLNGLIQMMRRSPVLRKSWQTKMIVKERWLNLKNEIKKLKEELS